MYFDDFIAQQIMKTDDPSSSHTVGVQSSRHLLRTLWNGVRQIAEGIDAFSSVQHRVDVPPDHGARSRPDHADRSHGG